MMEDNSSNGFMLRLRTANITLSGAPLSMTYLLILAVLSFLLFLLWFPGTQYPIHTDTIDYALLGESVWNGEGYQIFGKPYDRQPPMHAFVSYPFVALLGYSHGMEMSSLFVGIGVLFVSFFLLQIFFHSVIALGAVTALVLHPGFLYTTMVGGSDPLFAFLFLSAVLAYIRGTLIFTAALRQSSVQATGRARFLFCAFLLAGLASLTRYNGVVLFPLFLLHTWSTRRENLREKWFWGGLIFGGGLFGCWLLRNFLLFGNPLATAYIGEFSEHAPILQRLLMNILYYLNPLHNVFPILFPFALLGIARRIHSHAFLLFVILAASSFAFLWWVSGMRFIMPAIPLLLGFAVVGVHDFLEYFSRHRIVLSVIITAAILLTHAGSLCIYAYGSCNAAFDRTFGFLPKHLGISTEGFHSWDQARAFLNREAEAESQILAADAKEAKVWESDRIFRDDLIISAEHFAGCPMYRITQFPESSNTSIFITKDTPQMAVVREECP